MKPTTSRTGTRKRLLHAANSTGSIAGVLQVHLCALNVHLMQRQLCSFLFRQNTVDELFSLLKFLRARPLNDWQTFNEQIAQPIKAGRPVRAIKRLHVRPFADSINLPDLELTISGRSFSNLSCSAVPKISSLMGNLSLRFQHAIYLLFNANSIQTSSHFTVRFQNG